MDTELSGAEILFRSLLDHNVNTIFGYPGSCVILVLDCLYNNKAIHPVVVRHEQDAVHAASGYAQQSDSPGVVLVTSGPAATNTVTGIADAMANGIPLVVITGQVSSGLLGTDAFQEVDIISITRPVTKWNYQIRFADEIADTISQAFRIATSNRLGPVLLDITKDAQSGKALYTSPIPAIHCKDNFIYPKHPQTAFNLVSKRCRFIDQLVIFLESIRKDLLFVFDFLSDRIGQSGYYNPDKVINPDRSDVPGFGLPAAIGVKYAQPDKTVCLITDSWSFQSTMRELGILKEQETDLKIILLNNLSVKTKFDMIHPDFIQLVNAYHIKGACVFKQDNLFCSLQKAITSAGSYFLEIRL